MLHLIQRLGMGLNNSNSIEEKLLVAKRVPQNMGMTTMRLKRRTDSQVALSTTRTRHTVSNCTGLVLAGEWLSLPNNPITSQWATMFRRSKWCLMKNKSLHLLTEKIISMATRLSPRSQTRGSNSNGRLCTTRANRTPCSQVVRCAPPRWLRPQAINMAGDRTQSARLARKPSRLRSSNYSKSSMCSRKEAREAMRQDRSATCVVKSLKLKKKFCTSWTWLLWLTSQLTSLLNSLRS